MKQMFGKFNSFSDDLFCVTDFAGNYIEVNPAWEKILGYSRDEVIGRSYKAFAHPDDLTEVKRAWELGSLTFKTEMRFRSKDGKYRWLQWHGRADLLELRAYTVGRDITALKELQLQLQDEIQERKQIQAQLLRAERMASLGMLAAGVGHEINNPLTFTIANLQIAIEDLQKINLGKSFDGLIKAMSDSLSGAERVKEIVRNLKLYSRTEEMPKPHPLCIAESLEMAIKICKAEVDANAFLTLNIGSTPKILANRGELSQVFVNLLLNAAQSMPVRPREQNSIRINASTDRSGAAIVEISDNGAGIDEKNVEKIFDPFFTTKPAGVGTGLGLSICIGIIRSYGGEISATSRLGEGSTFRVRLPPATSEFVPVSTAATAVVKKEMTVAQPGVSKRVLVIDDERQLSDIVVRILKTDYQVSAINDSQEALQHLLKTGGEYDLILCDLMMPQLTGIDLFNLVDINLQPKFIFMTGGTFTPEAATFLKSVSNRVLEKPFNIQTIRNAVLET
jgi:PAS domain S-box-containing protein